MGDEAQLNQGPDRMGMSDATVQALTQLICFFTKESSQLNNQMLGEDAPSSDSGPNAKEGAMDHTAAALAVTETSGNAEVSISSQINHAVRQDLMILNRAIVPTRWTLTRTTAVLLRWPLYRK